MVMDRNELRIELRDASRNTAAATLTVGGRTLEAETSANVTVDRSGTPWLAPALIAAMRTDADLRIDAVLDSEAYHGSAEAQDVMHGWFPDEMHRITVADASSITLTAAPAPGVGCFFSGGLDSFYTLVKHFDEITHLIFIHGFDIPLHNDELANRTRTALRKAAADSGKQLIEMRTDVREIHTRLGVDWGRQSHGSILGHAAQLLSPHIGRAYIPSSFPTGELFPWASHPHLDPLWSSSAVEIIHDGNEADRPHKAAAVAGSKAATDNLRVCWQNKDGRYNCGKCAKCIMTMINIEISGNGGAFTTLPSTIPYGVYRRTYMDSSERRKASENLNAMREFGYSNAEMEDTLNRVLHRPTWYTNLLFARFVAGHAPQLARFLATNAADSIRTNLARRA